MSQVLLQAGPLLSAGSTLLGVSSSYAALPLGAELLADPEFNAQLTQYASGSPGFYGIWQATDATWRTSDGQALFNAAGTNTLFQDVSLQPGSYVLRVDYDISADGVQVLVQDAPGQGGTVVDYSNTTVAAGMGVQQVSFSLPAQTILRINLKAGNAAVVALNSVSLRPV